MIKYFIFLGVNFITLSGFLDPNVELKKRDLPPRHNECLNCHVKNQLNYKPLTGKLEREHQIINNLHGSKVFNCHNCHNVNNHELLLTTPDSKPDFLNSSPVCQTCHYKVFNDWTQGIHGQRTGSWNGKKIQFHCIDCHDPHNVKFPQMKASPPPMKPKFLIEKKEGHG